MTKIDSTQILQNLAFIFGQKNQKRSKPCRKITHSFISANTFVLASLYSQFIFLIYEQKLNIVDSNKNILYMTRLHDILRIFSEIIFYQI